MNVFIKSQLYLVIKNSSFMQIYVAYQNNIPYNNLNETVRNYYFVKI